MRRWATTFGGIPRNAIRGVRFPFRNYNQESIELLYEMGFEYDSSMAARGADTTWPYTLDYGAVNDCMGQTSVCGRELNAKGLWVCLIIDGRKYHCILPKDLVDLV